MAQASLNEVLAQAQEQLGSGDAGGAFSTLRDSLEFPATSLIDARSFAAAFALFAEVARAIAGEEFANLIQAVSADPDHPGALYDAGYAAYEHELFAIAATLLARANALAPGQAAIVAELATALEGAMRYRDAALALEASGLAGNEPMLAYLAGFSSLMCGEIDHAAACLRLLANVDDDDIVPLRSALAAMVHRAETVRAAGIDLGEHALTAWHAVLNGSLLLHESPFGYDEPMRGRYAMVSDSPSLMREGIERLGAVLSAIEISPPRVIQAPDRASSILATAVARALGCPLVDWGHAQETGLVVAWRLDEADILNLPQEMYEHRSGQILFAHASNWVRPFHYAPDVTTYLGQTITHPYLGGALRIDPETKQVVRADADTRNDAVLVAEILDATVTSPSQTPIDNVLALARALAALPPEERLGVHRTSGLRLRMRVGSPVHSARFL